MLLQEGTQDYAGFVQRPRVGGKEISLDAWKTFVYVNRPLFSGLWGESELRDVYPHWYYSEFFRALWADYLRFKAVPPIIAYAPSKVSVDEDGNEVDSMKQAGEILQRAFDNLVVVLPADLDEKGNHAYSYAELQIGDHGDVFSKAIEDLDVQILRGLVVPERTVTQDRAAVGSYNQAAVHEERMLDAGKMEVDAFCLSVNKYMLPALIEDHFGQNTAECTVYVKSISEALKAKLHNVLITVLQNDKTGIYAQHVKFWELLDALGIPYTVTPSGLPDPQVTDDENVDNQSHDERGAK
jgi:hypothetical protein